MAVDFGEKNELSGVDIHQVESCRAGVMTNQHSGTQRNIKPRHAQMIAIGGSIGTALFVGAGQALYVGGPAFLLIAYSLTSMLVYGIITAVIEIGCFLPVEGASMSYYCRRFVSPSLGFALGWLYFYSFGIIVAYEITAASIVIDFWPNNVPIAVWITVISMVIVALNLSPVSVYAETEFWFASIKVIMLLGLLLLSLILMCGGGPGHEVLGFRYWNDPGAIHAYLVDGASGRLTSFLYVWVFTGFSFYFGPELIVFTTGEMHRPRKNLPIAANSFFIRLVLFYIVGVVAIGVICSSRAAGLISGAGNANASPWVIAIQNAGIRVLPSIINAGILTSAWSAGNSYLYMSSRALYSLARDGHAPRIFLRCTSYGLPIYAVIASSLFSLLAYLNVSNAAGVVFNWFISLTNTAGYTSWIVCSIVYLRFRKATIERGVAVPYRARIQPFAAYICIFCFTILLLCNGFTVFYPGNFTVSAFMTTYLGIPIFVLLWLGHKLVAARQDPWLIPSAHVDLVTGLREVEDDEQAWAASEEPQPHASVLRRAVQMVLKT